jgi:D-glycero-alpha-D-manno-heptose-7-phosphate kinase
MVISRTPYRCSFLGGLTDYKEWSNVNGGVCIGSTIDKYCYLNIRELPPYHDYKSRYVYSKIEKVMDNSEIEHRAIKECVKYLGMDDVGLEVTHVADIPGRSGVGSSSAFVVGLLNGLTALQGKRLSPDQLTHAAIDIETQRLKEIGGQQDQAWAAYGGLNIMRFRKSGDIDVLPFALSHQHSNELSSCLLMFFTKISRISSHIAETYVNSIPKNIAQQTAIARLTEDGINAIYAKRWEHFGNLIDQSWRIKASYGSGVSNAEIDNLYVTARVSGAFGGKITGAGGGGMMLLVVPPDKQERVIKSMTEAGALHIPFNFECCGSSIIHHNS